MREQATVYVIRKKGTRRYMTNWRESKTLGTLANADIYAERPTLWPPEDRRYEVVPGRLTVLSSRTRASKKRTR